MMRQAWWGTVFCHVRFRSASRGTQVFLETRHPRQVPTHFPEGIYAAFANHLRESNFFISYYYQYFCLLFHCLVCVLRFSQRIKCNVLFVHRLVL